MSESRSADFVRLTVHGRVRRADVVLPGNVATALLIPQLLDLVDDASEASGKYVLSTLEGRLVGLDATLTAAHVLDGGVLRLTASGEMPPEPVVHDLVETVEHTEVPGRWAGTARTSVIGVLGTVLIVSGLWLLIRNGAPGASALGLLGVAVTGAVVVTLGRLGGMSNALAAPLLAGAAVVGVLMVVSDSGPPGTRALRAIVVLLPLLVAVGAVLGHVPSTLRAAALGVALAGGSWLLGVLVDRPELVAGVMAVVTTFVAGTLPRLALASASVFRLDAQAPEGDRLTVATAAQAVASAHWTLAASVAVCSVGFGAAGWVLGQGASGQPWLVALAVLTTLCWTLRVRLFPLAVERLSMWLSSCAASLGLVIGLTSEAGERAVAGGIGVAAAGLLVLALAYARPSEYQRAILRQTANRLEAAAVVASIPVLLGGFGVYADLLRTFR